MSSNAERPTTNPKWRHALGRAAEDHAARYLESRGCRVLERRFVVRGSGEIDLIVEHEGAVVFVEVKARRGSRYGQPIEAVTAKKQRRIVATARAYLRCRGRRSRRCRFDVVGVETRAGQAQVHWFRNAFRSR